jgi:hypothetical protein
MAPIQLCTEELALEVKWQGHEAIRSPPSSAKGLVKQTAPLLLCSSVRLHGTRKEKVRGLSP